MVEVIAQGAEVTLGVGVEPGIHMLLDDLALDLRACRAISSRRSSCASRAALSPR